MKLASYELRGKRGIGVVRDDKLVELGVGSDLPTQMEAFLELGQQGLSRAREIGERGGGIPLADVHLDAPIRRPRKFLAIAANYQSHIDEVKRKNPAYEPPVAQRWFNKQVTCINGPFEPIEMPHASAQLDYEAELAVVIGRRCRHIGAAEAPSVIAGYTICNDVSVRDWQRTSPTITLGKSFDTHGPLGPWLVTAEEMLDPHDLDIKCWVNGELRQHGNTREMIDNCYAQIAYLSTVFTLEPGDVLATGTPAGTGWSMEPQRMLKIGDVVRCEIEHIGAIEALVRAPG